MDIESEYNKALDYLYSFVDYSLKHASELAKADFNLDRMFALMESLGNPQNRAGGQRGHRGRALPARDRGPLAPDEIGIFYITPCTAIMNSILNPVGLEESYLDGALSIAEIYGPLLKAIKAEGPVDDGEEVSPRGMLWAMAGGEIATNGR